MVNWRFVIAMTMKSLEVMNEVAMKIEGEGKWTKDISHVVMGLQSIGKGVVSLAPCREGW